MGKELLSQADIRINGSRARDIQLHHAGFFKRVLQQGSLGLGESYMEGWWDCERLDILFCKILKAKLDQQMPGNLKDILRIASARLFNLQSRSRAWIVGKEHYDIGNDLFALMLDPHMQYSCAYWKDATTLDDAQNAKLKMICEKLQLKPGMRLLDIGCGWGGLAEYAARHYGVAVEGVTISKEQQKWRSSAVKDWTLRFCCRIIATSINTTIALSPWGCLNMSGQKTTTPISASPTVV